MKDTDRIDVNCNDCKIRFDISYGRFRKFKKGHLWRCRDCTINHKRDRFNNLSPEEKELRVKKRKNAWKNKSAEEMESISKKKKDTWNNKSDEEMQSHALKSRSRWETISDEEKQLHATMVSLHKKKYWENITPEQIKLRSDKISKINKAYWTSLSDEDKREYAYIRKLGWDSITEDKKEEIRNKISSSSRDYWNNMSDEERQVISDKRRLNWINKTDDEKKLIVDKLKYAWATKSDIEKAMHGIHSKNWWDDLSYEERYRRINSLQEGNAKWRDELSPQSYQAWRQKQAIGYNNYLNSLHHTPMKTESMFMNDLNMHGINYKWHHYNTIKDDRFDDKFPINPVTNSRFVSPFHQWDFKVDLIDQSVLVDVDGSIHTLSSGDFVTKDGIDVGLYIQFNDSQRPYQTDGMKAYVILAYDDNITDDTSVVILNTGEVISYQSFIRILEFMNANKSEQKKMLKLI